MEETVRAGVDAIREAILGPGCETDVTLRQATLERGRGSTTARVPHEIAELVDKIARHAYKVVDEDIANAKAAGYSEDALFEILTATAVGAGLERFDRGLAALREGRKARRAVG